jgi:hypothetical protein
MKGHARKKPRTNSLSRSVRVALVEIKPLRASPVGDIAECIDFVIKVAVVKRKGSSEVLEIRYSLLLTEKKSSFCSSRHNR